MTPLPPSLWLPDTCYTGNWGENQYAFFMGHDIILVALHSCLGVTILVVLQSQMACYPTTLSNEASAATQHEIVVLKMVQLVFFLP